MMSEAIYHRISNRYTLHEQIGHGGMGTVFRAYDRLTGEYVALKRVLSDQMITMSMTAGSDFRLALAQEFKLLATMHHPHVIEVRDYGFDAEGQPYFTMELLENTQTILEACVNQSLEKVVPLIVQTLQALEYLHRRGVLHRDLKPANILVGDGQVKVLDFGLSEMLGNRDGLSSSPYGTAGTIAYMAPEVLRGHAPTAAADLYAIGVILFEIFAGRYPFNDHNLNTLLNEILHSPPDMMLANVDFDFSLVIERLLQKDPESRFSTAREAINAINYAINLPIPSETSATRESFIRAAKLVGRDRELGQLSDAFQNALSGQGSAWLIAGESGVGKSRLVDELRTLAMVRGALVMRGMSVNEGKTPYHLWRNIFRWLALLVDMDEIDAGLIKLLVPDVVTLPAYNVEAAAELESHHVQSRLLKLLQEAFARTRQPVLIVLDDLQWAGSESLALLSSLIASLTHLPVLLVGSFRDDERPDLPITLPLLPIIKLGRLSQNHIVELSEAMLGEAGTHPQVVHLLQRETEGNVFFLVEVVRALAEEVGELDQIGRVTLPQAVFSGGIKQIIQRRLDQVPKKMRGLLQIAAILGRQIDLHLLRAIAEAQGLRGSVDAFLVACANAAVLEAQDGLWQFTHDKLREGVLERLSTSDRRTLHQTVAKTIEAIYKSDENVATLAYHWGRAGQHEREGHYVTLAGEQALRSGAYQQAIEYFERALQLMSPAALDTGESLLQRVTLQHRKAEAYLGFGGYTQARQLYQDSLAISERLNHLKGIADSLYGLGNVEYVRALFDNAEVHYRRSLETHEKLDDKQNIAKVLNSLGNIAYELGKDEEAKALYQQSLSIAREIGGQWGIAGTMSTQEPRAETNSQAQGRRTALLQDLMDYTQADKKPQMASTFYALGLLSQEANEHPEDEQNFRQATALYEQINNTEGAIRARNALARTLMTQGRAEEARAELLSALKSAEDSANLPSVLSCLVSFAHWYTAQKNLNRTVEVLAFVMGHDQLTAESEDEAERMLFDLQEALPEETTSVHWERGKAYVLADLLTLLRQP